MAKPKLSYSNPYNFSMLNNTDYDYFNFTMNNLNDAWADNVLSKAEEGRFKAIVLSGLVSAELGGAGTGLHDPKIVELPDGRYYYEIKIRPIGVTTGRMLPDPCEEGLSISERMAIVDMHPWARSIFAKDDVTKPSLAPSQEIICWYEKGSIANSNYSGLKFDIPPQSNLRKECLVQFNAESGDAIKNLFTGELLAVGDYGTVEEAAPASADNTAINSGNQIPDTQLPFKLSDNPIITSIMGIRRDPTGKRTGPTSHEGIDVGITLGKPLLAIADGVVHRAGPNGKTGATTLTIPRMTNGNTKASSAGYGCAISVKHTMPDKSGKPTTFYTVYGHVQDMLKKAGEPVKKGDVIATCGSRGGSTGPHLHMEVRMNQYRGSKEDPFYLFGWWAQMKDKFKHAKHRKLYEEQQSSISVTTPPPPSTTDTSDPATSDPEDYGSDPYGSSENP